MGLAKKLAEGRVTFWKIDFSAQRGNAIKGPKFRARRVLTMDHKRIAPFAVSDPSSLVVVRFAVVLVHRTKDAAFTDVACWLAKIPSHVVKELRDLEASAPITPPIDKIETVRQHRTDSRESNNVATVVWRAPLTRLHRIWIERHFFEA
jgi:hypothetical protein